MSITPTSRTPHFCHEGVMLLVVGASCLHWAVQASELEQTAQALQAVQAVQAVEELFRMVQALLQPLQALGSCRGCRSCTSLLGNYYTSCASCFDIKKGRCKKCPQHLPPKPPPIFDMRVSCWLWWCFLHALGCTS